MCSAVMGSLEIGDPCIAVGECGPGLACFLDGRAGTCGRVCCPGDESCEDGTLCVGLGTLVDGVGTDWWQCQGPRPCDLFAPLEVCEPGEGCYIVEATGDTDCRRAGTASLDEPCVESNDCAPGFTCGGLGSARRCLKLCMLGDAGAGTCSSIEGHCRAQTYTPEGVGICTEG